MISRLRSYELRWQLKTREIVSDAFPEVKQDQVLTAEGIRIGVGDHPAAVPRYRRMPVRSEDPCTDNLIFTGQIPEEVVLIVELPGPRVGNQMPIVPPAKMRDHSGRGKQVQPGSVHG